MLVHLPATRGLRQKEWCGATRIRYLSCIYKEFRSKAGDRGGKGCLRLRTDKVPRTGVYVPQMTIHTASGPLVILLPYCTVPPKPKAQPKQFPMWGYISRILRERRGMWLSREAGTEPM